MGVESSEYVARFVPRISLTVFLVLFVVATAQQSRADQAPPLNSLEIFDLSVEHKVNPIGIDTVDPRFAWKLASEKRGVIQAAYQIQVSQAPFGSGSSGSEGLLWDSGKVQSEASLYIPYRGPQLQSTKRYFWRVRVWDASGRASQWSLEAFWEMGLLDPKEWRARWIEPEDPNLLPQPSAPVQLRRAIKLAGKNIARARAYVTSHGLYEMSLNGRRVGDQLFTPGWTSYSKRLQYQTYDITDLLKVGENVIGATLGDGWYRGNLVWKDYRNVYGDNLSLLLQLHIVYTDGSEEWFGSDKYWKASTGPILMSEIYHGETYDARLEDPGWNRAGFDDSQWKKVKEVSHGYDRLVAPYGPPVKKIEEIKPIAVFKTPEGDTVVDMGQNMVGWVRLRVRGRRGQQVTLRHAEVLDKNGNFYTANLRTAKQTIQYTLKGQGEEVYEPHFTFQGFRYVAVEGFPGEVSLESLTGVVIHSDMSGGNKFSTSNPLINQLQKNILWGQKGNFLDVPTDCPQRDERLGWTGDAQVFARTAAFNMNVASFFTKWLRDLAEDQKPNGSVPHIVPDVITKSRKHFHGSAAWGDAATIIPWTLYLTYGDQQILEDQYASMRAWVEFVRESAGDDFIWSEGRHFGDWLAFSSDRSDYPGATTGKDYIATAYFAHSVDLIQKVADLLGKEADARAYKELLAHIKDAFLREFVSPSGRIAENTQTAYALALSFDLLPVELREEAAKRLAHEVRSRKHLTTGFVGTPYLTHALSDNGYLEDAYKLLNREEYPSWIYPVKQGATTIWERWDGQKPNGDFQITRMNSFNHYAYGAIGDWMYRVMAGLEIDPEQPGYKHTFIRPQPGGGFTNVSLEHESPYGLIESSWSIEGDQFSLKVKVPPNTTATISLPGAHNGSVSEGGGALNNSAGVSRIWKGDRVLNVHVGSGKYHFSYPMNIK